MTSIAERVRSRDNDVTQCPADRKLQMRVRKLKKDLQHQTRLTSMVQQQYDQLIQQLRVVIAPYVSEDVPMSVTE